MQDILENVEEERKYILRVKFFKQFLALLIIFGIILAVFLSFKSSNDKKLAATNAQLSDLMLSLKGQRQLLAERQQLESKLQQEHNPFTSFAKLKLVEFALEESKFQQAAQILEEIIAAQETDEIISNYARLMLVLICLDHNNLILPNKLAEHVKILDQPGFAFAGNAKIVKSLYLIKENRKTEAESLLKELLQNSETLDLLKVQASAIIASLYY